MVDRLAAVILAGGAGRRLGGTDKPARQVRGRAMLDLVLDAVDNADPRVVVGPPRAALPPGISATWEQPAGGGPVAAAAAGIAVVLAAGGPPEHTALLASDLPYLTRGAVDLLRARLARTDSDCSVYVDAAGVRQLLCGVWRTSSLAVRLATLSGAGGTAGLPVRALMTDARVAEVTAPTTGPPPWFDCDTSEDLRRAMEWSE